MSRAKVFASKFIRYLFLVSYAFVSVAPLLWLFINSFKKTMDIQSSPLGMPHPFIIDNYITIWKYMTSGFINSVIVSVSAVSILIVVALMAAYALARINNKSKLYTYFVLGILIPIQATLIPNFQIQRILNLIGTHVGLILLFVTTNLALAIIISHAFMSALPKELDESAYLDGASRSRIFISIIAPLSLPAVATFGILSFLSCWNDFLLSTIFLSNSRLYTITQRIYQMIAEYSVNYGALFAGMSLAVIPVLILYFFFQEQIAQGMTAGSVKG